MQNYEAPKAYLIKVKSEDICTLSFNSIITGNAQEFDFESIFNMK